MSNTIYTATTTKTNDGHPMHNLMYFNAEESAAESTAITQSNPQEYLSHSFSNNLCLNSYF